MADPQAKEPWEILADAEAADGVSVLVGASGAWGAEQANYGYAGRPCPACSGRKLPARYLCLVCHASRLRPDPLPMQAKPLEGRIAEWRRARIAERADTKRLAERPGFRLARYIREEIERLEHQLTGYPVKT